MEEMRRGGGADEGIADSSNGSDLSSPPPDHSPPRSHGPYNGAGENIGLGFGGPKNTPPLAATQQAAPAPKPKQTRKKKEPAAAADDGKPKEKKPRKPREPKDPNAPPKKRVKRTHDDPASKPAMPPQQTTSASASRQAKITDIVGTMQSPTLQQASRPPVDANQILASNAPTPSTPRPISSGQMFDPIRSANLETSHHAGSVPPMSPSMKLVNRASASPSITSLIDPPHSGRAPSGVQHHHPQHRGPAFAAPPSVTSAPVSPSAAVVKSNNTHPPHPTTSTYDPTKETMMEVERPLPLPPKQEPQSAGPSSTAPTPPTKSQRQKDAPPPLPTGSGLLSGTALGGIAPATNGTNSQGVNIHLHFELKGKTNMQVNFAREVQQKYGFAALYPRQAARKERRRQMAAAGAALENAAGIGSADDMSLDVSEAESDVAMGGVGDGASMGSGGKQVKKKKKAEEYDRADEFIDDTELAWEEQALMAKDGFFVYSGPLVAEGEKPAIERADGTVPKRGRGRGRGGSTRGETSGRGSRGGGRGSRASGEGGRGSRGGTTVRKPRVTKADRLMMEQEKMEREKMAATLAAKPQMPGNSTAAQQAPQAQQVNFHGGM